MAEKFYVTTPIYYVNDRPHIGHVYSTTLADILARFHRLRGDDVFFLTGTDEHAAKVVDSAAANNMTAQQWADRNAEAFQQTFARLGMSNDDFIRTSEPRHKERVVEYVKQLMATGDVYEGQYEGWYDAGQEEYVPENKAEEYGFKSPINGKPLIRKAEKNYFFALNKYQQPLLDHFEKHPEFVQPDARKNEILNRIREGLNPVPISRTGAGGWGIAMPNDPQQSIYVWIDALFNYISAVDTSEREKYWPADVHLIAKDILWFHAVIWPTMLMALKRPLPRQVYAHSFWIAEGQKMSKSLGNFIDLEKIDGYVATFSLDALRWFLATQGPLGVTDADFSHSRFVDVYNSDLANKLGNCFSRVSNMTARYFGGSMPALGEMNSTLGTIRVATGLAIGAIDPFLAQLKIADAAMNSMHIVSAVDGVIEATAPFKLAKDPANLPQVGNILAHCAEGLRIASLMLWPIMPQKMEELWRRIGCEHYTQTLANRGTGKLHEWSAWGQLQPGATVLQGDPLFPRYQPPK
jgi:methionyl-tRNA synthetase